MWLYNALKLKKIYSSTVFSTFWWLFKVSCGVLRCPAVFSHTRNMFASLWTPLPRRRREQTTTTNSTYPKQKLH